MASRRNNKVLSTYCVSRGGGGEGVYIHNYKPSIDLYVQDHLSKKIYS